MWRSSIIFAFFILIFTGCRKHASHVIISDKDSVEIQADLEHNSQNALDWNGVYVGVIPCADCSGINYQLQLFPDNTYELNTSYLAKNKDYQNPQTEKGNFEWSADGSVIELQNSDKLKFKIGENKAWLLNTEGAIIQGNLADNYILSKK